MPDAAAVRPIFVLGAPRSGTTLVGSYLSSAAEICDLGEYAGFFFVHHVADREYARVPAPHKGEYLEELREHALDFATRVARRHGCSCFCDSTPWNLLIAGTLVARLPDALFVLTVRDVRGVSQSLERSRAQGYLWAGDTLEERALLWRRFYSHVGSLDPDRTVVVDYDELCAEPPAVLDELARDLSRHGITFSLDAGALCESHANPAGAGRPTVGVRLGDGSVSLRSIPSYDAAAWPADADAVVADAVRDAADAVSVLRAAAEARRTSQAKLDSTLTRTDR